MVNIHSPYVGLLGLVHLIKYIVIKWKTQLCILLKYKILKIKFIHLIIGLQR
jgi:hypothetical protein